MKVAEMRRGGRKMGHRNVKNSLLIPVFCCMAFAVEYWYTARNIEHHTEKRRDVSFAPDSWIFIGDSTSVYRMLYKKMGLTPPGIHNRFTPQKIFFII